MSRVASLAAFEFRYQTWRITFLATLLGLVAVPVALVGTGFGPSTDAVNGAFIVTESLALVSLMSVFALPLLCVHAALRDDEHGMRGIVDAKPIARRTLLAMRGGGVLMLLLAVLALCTMLLAVLPFLAPPRGDRVVPFAVLPYVRAYAYIVVPNALWCTALLFAVAAATRSTLATFVASVCIYAGYMVTALMVDSPLMAGTRPPTPDLLARVALLDPFGLSAVFEQTRYLTPAERSTFVLSLSGHLLQNRALMLALGVLCTVPVWWFDERVARTPSIARRRWWTRESHAGVVAAEASGESAPPRSAYSPLLSARVRLHGIAAWLDTVRAVATLECRLLLASWPLLLLLVVWVVVILIEADGQLRGGEYGTRVLASTAQLADAVPQALELLGTIAVLYFAAEVFSRESITRFAGIRDATPAASSALLAGKSLALLMVPVVLTITGYAATVAVHLVSGGLPIEWDVLGAHAVVSLIPLAITTIMAASFQAMVGQRWVALLGSLLVVLFSAQGAAAGAEHPLWRFGAAPPIAWSDLSGYGVGMYTWLAFQGTWLLAAVTLSLVAVGLWSRGESSALFARAARAPRTIRESLGPVGVRMLRGSALSCVGAIALLLWVTTVHHPWVSEHTDTLRRVEYERRYASLRGVAQPSIAHVALSVRLEPRHSRAEIRGALRLINNTDTPIDTVYLAMPRKVAGAFFDRLTDGVRLVVRDSLHGVYTLALGSTLRPNESHTIPYHVTVDGGGIRADGNPEDVVSNGTYLHSADFLPRFGFARERVLQDSIERVRYGLPVMPDVPLLPATLADSLVREVRGHGHTPAWFTADVRIETDRDQIAHGPGRLVSHESTAATSRWTYQQTTPSTAAFVITSGRYAVLRDSARTKFGVVPVEVWYNPRHAEPAKRLMSVSASALISLANAFGRYPHPVLRVVEVSSQHRFGAYAMPGTIYLTETRGMLSDLRAGAVDLLRRRVGHEVAHQWWGHAVDPLNIVGRLLLVETMAKYAEQLLVAETQGETTVHDMLTYDEDRYFRSRDAHQPALVDMVADDALFYGKGALAMHAMRHLLGDSLVLRVSREVMTAHAGSHGTATARDFVSRLLDVAPNDEARAGIREWFTQRVIYDVALDTAVLQAVENDTRVSARFRATRHDVQLQGSATVDRSAALHNVGVPVGLQDTRGRWYVFRARAVGGVIAVDTTVAWRVSRIEIDPERVMLERDRGNNGFSIASPNQ